MSERPCNYPQVRIAVGPNPEGIAPSSPGLRACELPWEIVQTGSQPQRGCDHALRPRTHPRWGWLVPMRWTQGSSFLATLGFVAESLWDSRKSLPKMWVMTRSERLRLRGSLVARANLLSSFGLVLEPIVIETSGRSIRRTTTRTITSLLSSFGLALEPIAIETSGRSMTRTTRTTTRTITTSGLGERRQQ